MKLTHETRPVFELAEKLRKDQALLALVRQCIADGDAPWTWPVQVGKYQPEHVRAAVGMVDQ